jgi:polyribonucleotide nucleotidyltransferase
MDIKTLKTTIAGRELTIESGRLALASDGAVTVRYGDTLVLCTAMMSTKGKEGADFFPLTVEYQERYYASGKIKGSRFIKREGRPSDEATLKARLIDRPIRPLFPKGITNEVQIIATILSADMVNEPGVLSITGASAACLIAGMPLDAPLAGVRIGMIEGQLILFPTMEQIEKGQLDLTVAGTPDAITMVEAGAYEIDEETMLKAITMAHEAIKEICKFQLEFKNLINPTAREFSVGKVDDTVLQVVKAALTKEDLDTVVGKKKADVKAAKHIIEDKILGIFADQIASEQYSEGAILDAVGKLAEENMRNNILEKGMRIDGRQLDEIRAISCSVGVLPRTHGSALFQRGETQALTITTLGAPGAAQIIDTMDIDTEKRYIHYYNFPPYATGEVKPLRGTSRREIGHGFLAERALVPVIPSKEEFPYTMLLVSEIVTCNGSSSMASVCGSTLSLMDAGVPIRKPVAGVAMGLVTSDEFKKSGSGTYKILTDIQGMEDFAGDMDFKVTGTDTGITALQMDIKVKGITIEIMREALSKAKAARDFIMGKMLEALAKPRTELSKFAPLITSIKIDPDQIRDVIGKGGETIQKITAECGVEIDIDQSGIVMITSPDQISGQKAVDWVNRIVYIPKVGDVFEGTVVRIMDFGAFVEIAPGRDGLVHVSKLRPYRVNNVADEVKLGDKIKVKLAEIDDMGRLNLSAKEFYTGPMPGGQAPQAPQAPKAPEEPGQF